MRIHHGNQLGAKGSAGAQARQRDLVFHTSNVEFDSLTPCSTYDSVSWIHPVDPICHPRHICWFMVGQPGISISWVTICGLAGQNLIQQSNNSGHSIHNGISGWKLAAASFCVVTANQQQQQQQQKQHQQ